MEDSLQSNFARQSREREASKRYQRFRVSSCVSKETVKTDTHLPKEELRRYPGRFIESINFPDGHRIRLDWKIGEAFLTHFRDHFARFSNLSVQESSCY